ncbi:MAG: S-adenosylmethionine:tRNA ribosyltransferase-isomerase [Microbacter sp.]
MHELKTPVIGPQQLSIDAYDYFLPEERIAKFPLPKRDESKLLIYRDGNIEQTVFRTLSDHLPEGTLLVRNNTRVVQARLFFYKESGAKIELFCLEPHQPADYAQMFQQTGSCEWVGLVGNAKKWKDGMLRRPFRANDKTYELRAYRLATEGMTSVLRFEWDAPISFAGLLETAGELPIPPYLHRATTPSDKINYQTTYAQIEGSVAAPTAGLHFTHEVWDDLLRKGIDWVDVTLHVGAGTFRPVKSELMQKHEMHSESFYVDRTTLERLVEHEKTVVAVGTTSVRTLESLYYIGKTLLQNPNATHLHVDQWMPYEDGTFQPDFQETIHAIINYLDQHQLNTLHASTQLLIAPGYSFHAVNGIITNFHQPRSTLLLLVAALTGNDWKKIYDFAMQHDFRFLSYGDSSLLWARSSK